MRYEARFKALMVELEDQDWTQALEHAAAVHVAVTQGEKASERDMHPIAQLLAKYDEYIKHANEKNLYAEGWRPVTVLEFFDNELESKV